MWPIPAIKYEFVSISFSQDSVVCCWLQNTKVGTAPLALRAYRRYPLNNLEIHDLVIFNPTIIKFYISSFLNEYNLRDAFITFCLDCSEAEEKFMSMPTSTPHYADFGITQTRGMQSEYRYVYPHHNDQYVFYVYAVPRSLILQYELLAISLQCNLVGITTQSAAILESYKNIFGSAFRKSQLAVDMMKHDNNVESLISVDALRRMISVDADIDLKKEKLFITVACGVFKG